VTPKATLSTGQLARQAGVNPQSLRYYERLGLLPPPPRSETGYRLYPQSAVRRLRFIQRAKGLGFTLAEIEDLLSLRVEKGTSCAVVRAQAEVKIADIEGKLRELKQMKSALSKLAAACSGKGPTSQCPILDALEGNES
jgi:Zn(II)-responsive transcriptional regulator